MEALQRAQQLLGRRSAVRRAELAAGLQDLANAVAAMLIADGAGLAGDDEPTG